MTTKLSTPALLFAAFCWPIFFCTSQAAATTYTVNATAGSATMMGTITTDGTLGVLTVGNLTDWNLVIDFGGGSIAPLTGPLSGHNSGLLLTGILSATSAQLLFDFGNTDPNASEFEIAQLGTLPLYGVLWSAANGTRLASSIDLAFIPTRNGDDEVDNITSLSPEVLPIAQVETPLPATLPLFASGLGALGLFGRRRKNSPKKSPKRFRIACFAVAISGCLASINIAQAATIFSDFGAGNAFDHTSGWSVSGPTSFVGVAIAPAMPFTSPVDANVTQIDIAISNSNQGSSTVTTATLKLFVNTGGAVDAELGSFTVSNILNINGGPTDLSVSGISGVHLNAGGNYYLQASASGDTFDSWQDNSIALTGTLLFLRSDDPGHNILQDGPLGAFDIVGDITATTATPLPAALPLFATGLGALGALGWRRKTKAARAA